MHPASFSGAIEAIAMCQSFDEKRGVPDANTKGGAQRLVESIYELSVAPANPEMKHMSA